MCELIENTSIEISVHGVKQRLHDHRPSKQQSHRQPERTDKKMIRNAYLPDPEHKRQQAPLTRKHKSHLPITYPYPSSSRPLIPTQIQHGNTISLLQPARRSKDCKIARYDARLHMDLGTQPETRKLSKT